MFIYVCAMDLTLRFQFPKSPVSLQVTDQVWLNGSCFAEHIGHKIKAAYLPATINPHGILFNPLSIANSLQACMDKQVYTAEDVFLSGELWHSWNHHGCFAGTNKQEVLANMNKELSEASATFQQSKFVMLTFGSAWVYALKENTKVVANCHKMPANLFEKRLLTVKEIVAAYTNLFNQPVFKNKQVVLTVSPVRYVRDGLVENNQSKAVLLQAVHQLAALFNNVYYFPAYEIVVDELRDYRFFEKDMVHPNQLAIDYVWERFGHTFFDDTTATVVKELEALQTAALHKPLHPDTAEFAQFCKIQLAKAKKMQERFPGLKLGGVVEYFSQQLKG